jgi:iron complex outermembrane recepter protein
VAHTTLQHSIFRSRVSTIALLASMLGSPALAPSVFAQGLTSTGNDATTDAAPAETIIVTARRIEENLQEVPLTIRVLNEDMILREGVRSIMDVSRLSAGLTYDVGAFPNDTRPATRGMQSERGRPSVAIMLDGQDLSGENLSIAGGTAGIATELFDLERIEVVKGPQSTLYGRNAFAGAVNYISKRPSFTPEARALFELGSYGQMQATGSLTGPLIADKLAVRINLAANAMDGYYTNPVNKTELGAEQFQGGAIAFLFTPTDNIDVLARYQTSAMVSSDFATAHLPSTTRRPVPGGRFTAGPPGTPSQPCPASLTGLPASVVASCTRGALPGSLKASINDVQMGLDPRDNTPPSGMDFDQDVGFVEAKWRTGFGTLTYSFGYLKNDSFIEQDGDFTNYPGPGGTVLSLNAWTQLDYANEHTDHTLIWTHKFSRFEVLFGGQVFNEDSSLLNSSVFWLRNPASALAGPPFRLATQPTGAAYPALIERETEYTAVFARIKWQVTDKLNIGAEARLNADDIKYTIPGWRLQDTTLSQLTPRCIAGLAQGATFQGVFGPTVPPPGVVVACPRTETLSYEEVTPRFTIDYQLTPDILVYASSAGGYKPGGFNTNEVNELTGQSYLPEFLTAYELGIKSQFLDRRLTINADIYFNDYTDQQIGVQRVNDASNTFVATAGIINAGSVEAKGLEIDAEWQTTDRLMLGFSYAYTDAVFKEFIGGPPPGATAADFAACGVPFGQTSSDQTRADAGNICADFSGKDVAKSPKHAVNGMALYRAPLGQTGNFWFVELAAQYRSKRFVDESNLTWMDPYTNLDLTAGVEFRNVTVTGYIKNLTDDDTIRMSQRNIDQGRPEGFAPGRAYTAYLPAPRVYGLRANFRFN